MKIKTNELNRGEWKYIGTPKINLYEGKVITYKYSKRYGYRFNIILLNDKYYITQCLYTDYDGMDHISVYEVKSVNDAKAVLEVMIQFVTNSRHKNDA